MYSLGERMMGFENRYADLVGELTSTGYSSKVWTGLRAKDHFTGSMENNPIRDQLRAMLVNEIAPLFRDTTLEAQRAALDAIGGQAVLPANFMVGSGTLGGVPVEVLTPMRNERRVVLHAHGGGFSVGSRVSHRGLVGNIGEACRARVVLPEYRLAPEHPFPTPLDDMFSVYRALLASGTPAEQIVITGDSAGGNLAVALLLRARAANLPLPRAVILLSPWLDLTCSGSSYESRATVDPWIRREDLETFRDRYLQGVDPSHPLASPCFADLTGLPPMLIQVGDHEVLLSDSERLYERARAAGVDVTLEVQPEVWHVWHLMAPMLPDAVDAFERISSFVEARFAVQPVRIAS